MRYEYARELLAMIKWELDVGKGARDYDWQRACDAAAKLYDLFNKALVPSK